MRVSPFEFFQISTKLGGLPVDDIPAFLVRFLFVPCQQRIGKIISIGTGRKNRGENEFLGFGIFNQFCQSQCGAQNGGAAADFE